MRESNIGAMAMKTAMKTWVVLKVEFLWTDPTNNYMAPVIQIEQGFLLILHMSY